MRLRSFLPVFFLLVGTLLLVPPTVRAEVPTEEGSGAAQPGYLPQPLVERSWDGEVLGSSAGHFHPFLSIEEYYTDNLYNTAEDEEEEFVTVISPGLWLSFPAGVRQPLRVTTLNSAPGGLVVTRFPVENHGRLQGYALYRADITEHKNFSEEDNTYQRAEGLLSYNFRGGLSLELIDIFEINQEPYSTGESGTQLDEYTSNLVQLMVDFRLSPKTRLRADFNNFSLDYDNSARNGFREREDNSAAFYVFYRVLPKTSLLLEYDYNDIDYDEDTLADSEQKSVFAGLRWESSEKSNALFKLGHNWRDTKDSATQDGGSREDFIGEIRLDYRFSPKTSTFIAFTRRVEETDIRNTNSVLTHRAQLGYRQNLTPRLNGTVELYGYRDDYRGNPREDDYFGGRVAVGYLFRRWLNFGVGYSYLRRDSNISAPDYDYRNNTVFATATAAL